MYTVVLPEQPEVPAEVDRLLEAWFRVHDRNIPPKGSDQSGVGRLTMPLTIWQPAEYKGAALSEGQYIIYRRSHTDPDKFNIWMPVPHSLHRKSHVNMNTPTLLYSLSVSHIVLVATDVDESDFIKMKRPSIQTEEES